MEKKLDLKKLLEMSIEEREVEIFKILRQIDVSEHIEKLEQNNITLSYLSWAWAFDTIQQMLPISYKVKHFTDMAGNEQPYMFDENTGYMVETEMTILGVTKTMWLPVMDSNNRAMKKEAYNVTFKSGRNVAVQPANMFDVNKTIMRCLVKNVSLFGLGLYIYAGEDLPERPKEYITQEQIDEMKKLGVKIDGVLKSFNVSDITLLEKTQADYVITSKRNYLEKQKKESESNGNNA